MQNLFPNNFDNENFLLFAPKLLLISIFEFSLVKFKSLNITKKFFFPILLIVFLLIM